MLVFSPLHRQGRIDPGVTLAEHRRESPVADDLPGKCGCSCAERALNLRVLMAACVGDRCKLGNKTWLYKSYGSKSRWGKHICRVSSRSSFWQTASGALIGAKPGFGLKAAQTAKSSQLCFSLAGKGRCNLEKFMPVFLHFAYLLVGLLSPSLLKKCKLKHLPPESHVLLSALHLHENC